MGSEFILRRYRPADRERVEAVMESALRDAGVHFEEAPPDADGTLTEEYLDSGGEFLVGEVDGRIVATGAFRPPGGFVTECLDDVKEGAAEIKRMHVAPDYQRRGYGQHVLDELQRRARNRGHTVLVLNTSSIQTPAHRFYESNGFAEIGREPVGAGGKSFDLVFYRKSL